MNWCVLGMWRRENKILKIKRHALSFLFFEKIKTVWKYTVLRITHELHQVEVFYE